MAGASSGSSSPRSGDGTTGSSSAKPQPPPKPQRRPKALLGGADASSPFSSSAPLSPATGAAANGPTTPPMGAAAAAAGLAALAGAASSGPSSPSKRVAGLQLLGKELALEAAEAEQGLLSPFTSLMGLALALDSSDEEGGSSSSSSSSTPEEQALPPLPAPLEEEQQQQRSLLDGVAQALALASPEQEQQQEQEQGQQQGRLSPRLSLGDDGFVTSPPTPTAAPTGDGRPPPAGGGGSKKRQSHLRRISLPSLPLPAVASSSTAATTTAAATTPRSGGSSGLSLEALKAKLSGRSSSAATPTAPASSASPTPASAGKDEALLLVESARRLGWDISGLRKALLVRVLGVEPLPTAAGNSDTAAAKSKRHRSASLGMVPAAWLKRNSNNRASPTTPATPSAATAASSPSAVTTPASGASNASSAGSPAAPAASNEETYTVVIWVMDVESGQEWRVRKGPRDLLALHATVSSLAPTGDWDPPRADDFPLLPNTTTSSSSKRKGNNGSSSSTAPVSVEKQARLEAYLRALAAAGPGALEAAKVLQDFVGATERVDVLADAEARLGDEAGRLSRQVQLQGLELLREPGTGGYAARLEGFVREAQACDVQRTELLKAYVSFLGDMAAEMVRAHGPRLRAPLLQGGAAAVVFGGGRGRRQPSEQQQGQQPPSPAEGDVEEMDRFCVAALSRLLEAETFLPLRLRLYERVMLETDLAQEKALASKCALFKSFFGIPVQHISLSSWETAVAHLRLLSGESTALPSEKLDVLVAAVREVHALFRREHHHPGNGNGGGSGTDQQRQQLSADDLLPIFIYILCQCGIARLLSLKTMLAALGEPARMLAEAGYCLATLEAAIDYIVRMDENAGEI